MAYTAAKAAKAAKAAIWRVISGMRSYIACHIPDRRSDHVHKSDSRLRLRPQEIWVRD